MITSYIMVILPVSGGCCFNQSKNKILTHNDYMYSVLLINYILKYKFFLCI